MAHFHKVTDEVRMEWGEQDRVSFNHEGQFLSTGDLCRMTDDRGRYVGGIFEIGAIIKGDDGVFRAHMVGYRTGLYMGLSGDLRRGVQVPRK